jgi:hypothetical protein
MINYDNGILRDGSSIGEGAVLGNISGGIIRDGEGNALGHVDNGVVKDGASRGSGNALFNVKRGMVRNGSTLGSGLAMGKISDFSITGMALESPPEMVAAYHFLINKITN